MFPLIIILNPQKINRALSCRMQLKFNRCFFRLDDGLIIEYYEYTNPMRLLDGMGIPHPDLPVPEETTQKYSQLGLL